MNTTTDTCNCNAKDKVVLACSGASDLGEMSDIIARKLRNDGMYKMNCLAKIGFRAPQTIKDFANAELLVIDGCSIDCGKKTLEQAGLSNYKQFRITDHGFSKGNCPASDANITSIYSKILS